MREAGPLARQSKPTLDMRYDKYMNHLSRLKKVQPTINIRPSQNPNYMRSLSHNSSRQPIGYNYQKIISQRKIMEDDIVEGKRMHRLLRKRKEDFEKMFSEAVGYSNNKHNKNIKFNLEQERRIIKDNSILMKKLKHIKEKESSAYSNKSLNNSYSNNQSKFYNIKSFRNTAQDSVDYSKYRKLYEDSLITSVHLPKIKSYSIESRYRAAAKTAERSRERNSRLTSLNNSKASILSKEKQHNQNNTNGVAGGSRVINERNTMNRLISLKRYRNAKYNNDNTAPMKKR